MTTFARAEDVGGERSSPRKRPEVVTTLCDLFSDFPPYGRDVQVHHLLQHTSGLRDYFGLLLPDRTEQVSDADVLQMMREQSGTDFPPGSAYAYSNTGYCVLAEIIAADEAMDRLCDSRCDSTRSSIADCRPSMFQLARAIG